MAIVFAGSKLVLTFVQLMVMGCFGVFVEGVEEKGEEDEQEDDEDEDDGD